MRRIQFSATGVIDQEERGGDRRAVSEDGSRIVFMTAEPLSSRATNGLVNVYEWHEGAVSLVSCGCSPEPDSEAVITPSGRDLFFVTSAGLVTGDTDGAPDIYDARIGGGFPVSEAPVERCEGDACQGPLTNPAPLLVPGSAVQAPGENAAPAPAVVGVKAKPQAKKKGQEETQGQEEAGEVQGQEVGEGEEIMFSRFMPGGVCGARERALVGVGVLLGIFVLSAVCAVSAVAARGRFKIEHFSLQTTIPTQSHGNRRV